VPVPPGGARIAAPITIPPGTHSLTFSYDGPARPRSLDPRPELYFRLIDLELEDVAVASALAGEPRFRDLAEVYTREP
jgi:hypothetical protein